ncbi:hypothetical protein SGPA1_21893 [Streptomyces misionensis JCM 4497]
MVVPSPWKMEIRHTGRVTARPTLKPAWRPTSRSDLHKLIPGQAGESPSRPAAAEASERRAHAARGDHRRRPLPGHRRVSPVSGAHANLFHVNDLGNQRGREQGEVPGVVDRGPASTPRGRILSGVHAGSNPALSASCGTSLTG